VEGRFVPRVLDQVSLFSRRKTREQNFLLVMFQLAAAIKPGIFALQNLLLVFQHSPLKACHLQNSEQHLSKFFPSKLDSCLIPLGALSSQVIFYFGSNSNFSVFSSIKNTTFPVKISTFDSRTCCRMVHSCNAASSPWKICCND
jgi:hypothetical protein